VWSTVADAATTEAAMRRIGIGASPGTVKDAIELTSGLSRPARSRHSTTAATYDAVQPVSGDLVYRTNCSYRSTRSPVSPL